MKIEVSAAIEELKRQFGGSSFIVNEDGQGGARIVIENVAIGTRYKPETTWVGFQIPALYPYADIYPVFIGGDVMRVDAVPFSAPITPGHQFEGRPALQVSRRNGSAHSGLQKATAKILKILDFLEKLP